MEEQFKPILVCYDFRIYPTKAQKKLFAKTFGACRYAYNRLLAEAKAEYEAYKESCKAPGVTEHKKPSADAFNLTSKLVIIKSEEKNFWLYEVSSTALQCSAINLSNDLKRFFSTGKDCPKFKKKHGHQYFTLTKNAFRFKEGKLYLAKSEEPLEVHYTRELPSEPSNLTISKTPSGEYYISFLCKYSLN
jgi:putative transposase